MVTDKEYIEMLLADVETLQAHITKSAEMKQDLRNRLHKAMKKNLLMEILLTMDLPRDRMVLSTYNVAWLLRNIQINNADHPELNRAQRLLVEFVKVDNQTY